MKMKPIPPNPHHASLEHLPIRPQAVLFDLDGTLVETKIDFAEMKRGVLQLTERYGCHDPDLVELDILGIIHESASRLEEPRALELRQDAESLLTRIELDACREAKPIPAANRLLDRLAIERIKVGIVTRNCRASAEMAISRFSLRHDVLLTRNDVTRTKPHPEQLWQALEMLNSEPSESIMVGDHRMDVEGGRRAGMWTVGILNPGVPEDFFTELEPDRVVQSLDEIIEWIFPSS